MKQNVPAFWVLIIFSFLSTSILLSAQTMAMANETVGVKIMEKEMIGRFLADGNSMTLYSFAKDEQDTSNCIEGCAVNWPPFHVDPAAVIEGCETGDFATITRTDGKHQTTYKGMPLYYFKNDKYPGDTFGHGLGDVWFLITP